VKVWVSTSEEGWLLPSDTESWKCTQTLELNSSAKPTLKDAFFNQVAALPHAGLLLLANAQRNAIYAVHLEYGPNPESTRMDYLAEFTVTMPILSFTGTSDILPHGEHVVQVYCVQTQAIQQYALDLAQCLPPPSENVGLDKSDSSVSRDVITAEGFASLESSAGRTSEISLPSSAPKIMMQASSTDSGLVARYPLSSGHIEAPISREISSSNIEAKTVTLAPSSSDADIVCVPSPRLPLSPRLSRKLSDFRSPQSNLSDHVGDQAVNDYSVERQMDTIHRNLSDQLNSDLKNDESGRQGPQQNPVSDGKEKLFCQASDLGIEMARECGAIGGESYITEQTGHVDSTGGDSLAQPSNAGDDRLQDLPKDVHEKVSDSSASMVVPPSPAPNAKGKRQKGKNSQPSGPSSPSPSACNSTDSSNEPNGISNLQSTENGLPQIMAMQESINQVISQEFITVHEAQLVNALFFNALCI
jgi:enhancer of mRNA-decapping protein 4